jgi:hypothetical protein
VKPGGAWAGARSGVDRERERGPGRCRFNLESIGNGNEDLAEVDRGRGSRSGRSLDPIRAQLIRAQQLGVDGPRRDRGQGRAAEQGPERPGRRPELAGGEGEAAAAAGRGVKRPGRAAAAAARRGANLLL